MKRKDIREKDEYVPLSQLSTPQYSMSGHLCFMGSNDTHADIINAIVATINEYYRVKTNNMNQFRYFGEVTKDCSNDALHDLDN